MSRLDYRPASIDDASVVVSLMTEGISRWVAAWPFPLSVDQARSILQSTETHADLSQVHPFIVSEDEAGRDIGWLKIAVSDRGKACWEIGYWIGEDFQGRGFAKEIAGFALAYCFHELKAERVFAGARRDNIVSLKLLEKMGMQHSHSEMVFAPARKRFEECEYRVIDKCIYLSRIDSI